MLCDIDTLRQFPATAESPAHQAVDVADDAVMRRRLAAPSDFETANLLADRSKGILAHIRHELAVSGVR